MSDMMRPLSFKEAMHRIVGEYKEKRSVFGIDEKQFFQPRTSELVPVFNESCSLPLGPAAGPHTQLCQNILASYLTGARFIELKTVQILDTLEIEKPCIDATDECFNTEWSSEYTLPKALDEYLKGWFLLHLIEALFFDVPQRSFIFNMSVGYDLEGIRNPRVDAFIEGLKDASSHEKFRQYQKELEDFLSDSEIFQGTGLEKKAASLKGLPERVSPKICSQLTLSTMHGCPPDEIEKICHYMLTEKKLDTFVKLNPTLLGYDFVSSFINASGYDYIDLSPVAFSHDLQYLDALPMLKRLRKTAEGEGREFGVKLTNTLGTVNRLGRLPGDEMYMSGRLLFPLSINVAARLAEAFNGDLKISFSGGIFRYNIEDVLQTGIWPITLATDLLKPGGYLRLNQLAEIMEEKMEQKNIPLKGIDVSALKALAEKSLTPEYRFKEKDWHGHKKVEVDAPLPLTNCYVAPCMVACPIHQDVPAYIKLVSQERYVEALELIYEKNALPSITAFICAHQCQYNCTRIDYEGAVEIREIKKIALQKGFDGIKKKWSAPALNQQGRKAAVIGAGPAGLSAAYFLAREGIAVTVFDEHEEAGGVVEYQIPDFRIPREAIRHDIEFIKEMGVEFRFNYRFDFHSDVLKQEGYEVILLAVGADRVRSYSLKGDKAPIMSSHALIGQFNRDRDSLNLGKEVVVVGAGDTAMDAARTALQVKGVEKVTLAYRRSKRQMPCTEEEYQGALKEGVEFLWLRNPVSFESPRTLHLEVMELGEPDASGRRSPVATGRKVSIPCDSLIPSIGETVDTEEIAAGDFSPNEKGWFDTDDNLRLPEGAYMIGDVRTGPTTIVNCIAEARKAVDAICRKEGIPLRKDQAVENLDDQGLSSLNQRRGSLLNPLSAPGSAPVEPFAVREASRCLECHLVCNKCVDVCPNRANIALPVEGLAQAMQIVHLDAYCNECGNCGTFCPWQGTPYQNKPTLFSRMDDFENSSNPGFYLEGETLLTRKGNKVEKTPLSSALSGEPGEELNRIFRTLYEKHRYLFGPVEE